MFLVRGGLRRLASRIITHPIAQWPFSFGKPDRLLIAPQDLRTTDATRASEIYAGRFAFAGKVVICDARSPFEGTPPSEDWAVALHGFGWLRHLRAAESAITRANARALIDEWITLNSAHDPIAWRPEVIARRVVSWLTQAPLVLDESDARFYRRFLRSLTRQVRHLRHSVADARDGVPRFQVVIALLAASLCMAGQQRHIRSATKRFNEELQRQILPDGGHISRNPGALLELMIDLLPLRTVFTSRNIAPPPPLLNAIDRMMPMLRFFRHGDGNFALFNGMGPTRTDVLTTVLAYDDTRGAPLANAPHSGYQRIEAAGTLVLMETGHPPPISVSQDAHAGCLSFELSVKQQRIVVNCGLPATSRESWRQAARATAAHATVTFNDTSSCRFIESSAVKHMMHGIPMIGGPREVTVAREETTKRRGRADVAQRLCRHLQYRPPSGAHAGARRPAARWRGHLRAGEGRQPAGRPRPVRRPLSSPSVGQGQPPGRWPQRRVDDAEQGGVELQRLRGPHRHRGERLSRR